MKYSEILKDLRTEQGLTQKELSKKIGITASAIGFLENGQREPMASTLLAYANYFGVSIDYLMGREDNNSYYKIFQEENFSPSFPNKIKFLREKNGLTQSALAHAINTSQRNISRWEKGEIEMGANFAITLARYFNVSVEYLLGMSDESAENDFSVLHNRKTTDINIPSEILQNPLLPLSDKEINLLKEFRRMLPEMQDLVITMMKSIHPDKVDS